MVQTHVSVWSARGLLRALLNWAAFVQKTREGAHVCNRPGNMSVVHDSVC